VCHFGQPANWTSGNPKLPPTTHSCHRIIECGSLIGTLSAEGIMASGQVNRKGRNTRQRTSETQTGNGLVPCREQPVFAAYPRNRTHRCRLSKRSTHRTSTGILKKPTVIDRWENGSLHDLQDQTTKNNVGRLSCPQATKRSAAFERLRLATPICDDASLMKLEEDVTEYLREARRRDASGPDGLISTALERVARKYFQHILLKQSRVTPLRRRTCD